jgi:hypothetical protein
VACVWLTRETSATAVAGGGRVEEPV